MPFHAYHSILWWHVKSSFICIACSSTWRSFSTGGIHYRYVFLVWNNCIQICLFTSLPGMSPPCDDRLNWCRRSRVTRIFSYEDDLYGCFRLCKHYEAEKGLNGPLGNSFWLKRLILRGQTKVVIVGLKCSHFEWPSGSSSPWRPNWSYFEWSDIVGSQLVSFRVGCPKLRPKGLKWSHSEWYDFTMAKAISVGRNLTHSGLHSLSPAHMMLMSSHLEGLLPSRGRLHRACYPMWASLNSTECPIFGDIYAEGQKCNGHVYVTKLFAHIQCSRTLPIKTKMCDSVVSFVS